MSYLQGYGGHRVTVCEEDLKVVLQVFCEYYYMFAEAVELLLRFSRKFDKHRDMEAKEIVLYMREFTYGRARFDALESFIEKDARLRVHRLRRDSKPIVLLDRAIMPSRLLLLFRDCEALGRAARAHGGQFPAGAHVTYVGDLGSYCLLGSARMGAVGCHGEGARGCIYGDTVLQLTAADPEDFVAKCRADRMCPYRVARRQLEQSYVIFSVASDSSIRTDSSTAPTMIVLVDEHYYPPAESEVTKNAAHTAPDVSPPGAAAAQPASHASLDHVAGRVAISAAMYGVIRLVMQQLDAASPQDARAYAGELAARLGRLYLLGRYQSAASVADVSELVERLLGFDVDATCIALVLSQKGRQLREPRLLDRVFQVKE